MNSLNTLLRRRTALLAFVLALGLDLAGPARVQAQNLTPNPATAGLWVGEVTLTEVLHSAGGTNAPTADSSQLRILLHVDASGAVRLLKEAIVAKRVPASSANVMIFTDPAAMATAPGLLRQGGRLIAQRIASVAYDFAGFEAPLNGGIGQGFRCEGQLTLPANHPTNPFLHRFHPDHSVGLEIVRTVGMRFLQPIGQFNGIDRLTGEYQETLTGLSKGPLTVRGTVVLNRVSPYAQLNR